MEVDDDAPSLKSLLGDRRSSSPDIQVLAHNFPRIIYQDHLKPKASFSKQPVQEVVTAKPRGRPRKQPVASSLKVPDPGPSSGRVTRSQAGPVIVKYVSKLAKSKADEPVDSDSSKSSKSPSPIVPDSPKPVKRGPGRPKGSKNTKAASQLDADPSHIRIAIPPASANNPATDTLRSLTSRLEEASEVRILFL